MNTYYKIVDADGDEIKLKGFKPETDIPVTVQSVRFIGDDMVITLRYLHDA